LSTDRETESRPLTTSPGPNTPGATTSVDDDTMAQMSVVGAQLSNLQQQMNRLHRTVRLTIEAELSLLTGRQFGSLVANEEVVGLIQNVLETHGLRIQCPECGHPAILRCSGRPGLPNGAFVLDHTIEGRRTFHGGYSILPALRLMAKPRRKTKKKAS